MSTALLLGLLLKLDLASIRMEADRLKDFVSTPLAKSFVAAANRLPAIEERTVYYHEPTKTYFPSEAAAAQRQIAAKDLTAMKRDEKFYYYTKYGSPLAYARVVDLMGSIGGLKTFARAKLVDFGYGGIGPLRMIAECGGNAVGLDIDTLLKALYSQPSDTGRVGKGRVDLIEGYFPTDAATVRTVGGGYDVFLSKNTLKKGYVHPEKPVDKRLLVDLGVSDQEFCYKVASILKKNGLFVIYNLSPAQNPPDKPYLPWADGRCPFDRAVLESAGFEVLAFDAADDTAARELGRRLGWDQGANPMDFEKDLFSHYTIARRRR